jgi:hypothetical protein
VLVGLALLFGSTKKASNTPVMIMSSSCTITLPKTLIAINGPIENV